MTVDQIKSLVDLADRVRSVGIELSKHGTKDLKGLCPFHADENPSLIVSPDKNLFHCPACGAGGSVIDFVMKFHDVPLNEAVRMLSEESAPAEGKRPAAESATRRELPLERQNELLEKTVAFYERTFADAVEGRKYLEGRGLTDAGLFSKHRLGFADGSLLKALPSSGEIVEDLKILGVLLENGRERFHGCVAFPILDDEGRIVTLCGRSIKGKRHLFLPGRPTGLFNVAAAKTYPELVLVESAIDALSLESSGVPNVVAIQGTNGLGDGDARLLRELSVEKLAFLLDGDEAGRAAALRLADKFSSSFSCVVLRLPEGKDPNDYFQEFGAEKTLEFIANGFKAPEFRPSPPPGAGTAPNSPVAAPPPAGGVGTLQFDLRKYELLGVERKSRSMKATVRATKAGKLHVDTIDFYSSRQRRQLQQDLVLAFDELPETIEGDVARLLKACETRAADGGGDGDAAKEEKASDVPPMSATECREAEEFGRSSDLVERILADFAKCGLVGEEANKLLCYLAMTSRKMSEPLSVLILSSSGAGKTALQDAALGFCPPEELVKLTNLSGKALFYKEKTSLKHKVLAIEEGAGAEEASYAIRSLISSEGLTSEVAVRDPATGKLTTMSNTVDGPTAVFVTTTNPEVDPETRSRFLVTGIDESREQTRRILESQRRRRGIDGLKDDLEVERVRTLHRNFQRLLKPVRVVNPLVDDLGYRDDRLQGRRAQPQYLALIDSVAFLRQSRKEIKTTEANGSKVEYVEADVDDVAKANELAVEILGRSLDELSIPSRNLLEQIEKMLDERLEPLKRAESDKLHRREDLSFTRRELRDFSGWTNTRVHVHLKELMEMEHVLLESGRGTSLQRYKLVYDGQGKDGSRFIPGIKDVADMLGLKKVGGAPGAGRGEWPFQTPFATLTTETAGPSGLTRASQVY